MKKALRYDLFPKFVWVIELHFAAKNIYSKTETIIFISTILFSALSTVVPSSKSSDSPSSSYTSIACHMIKSMVHLYIATRHTDRDNTSWTVIHKQRWINLLVCNDVQNECTTGYSTGYRTSAQLGTVLGIERVNNWVQYWVQNDYTIGYSTGYRTSTQLGKERVHNWVKNEYTTGYSTG